ncbi:uncharacterized protein KZ484_013609 [Pholidichthys leucotaenia]
MSLLEGPLNVLGQRTTGESVRTQNVMAAASIIKSSLGPVGLDKMLVDDIGVTLRRIMAGDDSAAPDSTGASQTDAATVQLPDFWQNSPRSWFNAVEAQFHLRRISADATKFYHVVAKLDNHTAQRVESLINRPPDDDKYGTLKGALIHFFTPSLEERAEKLLALTECEVDRPADLMAKMLSLRDSEDDGFIFTHLFLRTLPSAVRVTLASSQLLAQRDYHELGQEAQRLVDAHRRHTATTAAAELGTTSGDGREPEAAAPDSLTTAAAEARRRGVDDVLCFYHRRFAERARKCIPPCHFKRSGNAKTGSR